MIFFKSNFKAQTKIIFFCRKFSLVLSACFCKILPKISLKKHTIFSLLFLIPFFLKAQEIEEDFEDLFWTGEDIEIQAPQENQNSKKQKKIKKKEENLFDEDWENAFLDSEDFEVAQNEIVLQEEKLEIRTQNFFIPLKFSGSLSTSIGLFDAYSLPDKNNFSGFFLFENKLYLLARIDRTFSLRGTIKTTFPPIDSTSLEFSDLYIDYLLLNWCYLTLGKKTTSWGYTRIFSTMQTYRSEEAIKDDDVLEKIRKEEENGFLYTDILYDSGDTISALLRIPFWTGMFSGIVMYSGSINNPSFKDLSFALSIELTFGSTSFNLFGRKYPYDQNGNYLSKEPLFGLEVKRTFFGFDAYAQQIFTLENWRTFEFERSITTAGFYKLWDTKLPHFGMNLEVQNVYNWVKNEDKTRVALELGIKKLGKKFDMKIGMNWHHYFFDNNGYFRFVFIKSGIFPHADWENSIQATYDFKDAYFLKKVTIASAIKLSMDY